MKHFMIRYRFTQGTPEAWHAEIARFTAALDTDPELAGKLAYRAMKVGDGPEYCHLAAVADEAAQKALGSRAFFEKYTAETERVGGGKVEVIPLEIVAETAYRAWAISRPRSTRVRRGLRFRRHLGRAGCSRVSPTRSPARPSSV